MRVHLVASPDGRIFAPSQYTICINSSPGKSWLSDQSFLEELTQTLEQAAKDAGFLFSNKPVIQLSADYNLPLNDLRIEVPSTAPKLSDTTNLSPHSADMHEDLRDITLLHAFLIVNSTYNYRLGQSVVNIGRRKDNHLVIDDLRVSRVHAQLRPIKGRYVLFDLNSKGGTFVNDQRISQYVLNPGDVISLAGVPLIYGQDTAPNLSHTTSITPRPVPGSQPDLHPEADLQQLKRHST
jgi:hypothetical protein